MFQERRWKLGSVWKSVEMEGSEVLLPGSSEDAEGEGENEEEKEPSLRDRGLFESLIPTPRPGFSTGETMPEALISTPRSRRCARDPGGRGKRPSCKALRHCAQIRRDPS
jgi:hypothetical protein